MRTGWGRRAHRGSRASAARLDPMASARPAGSGTDGKRPLYLIQGDDPYRARLRAAELVAALATGDARPSDLRAQRTVDLGTRLGLTRHDARTANVAAIELSGASQGLFDAVDELRIVVVEHAEALKDGGVVARFPAEAALVLVSETKPQTRARRAPAKAKAAAEPVADLASAVEAAGGTIEGIRRLQPQELGGWLAARGTPPRGDLSSHAIRQPPAAGGTGHRPR